MKRRAVAAALLALTACGGGQGAPPSARIAAIPHPVLTALEPAARRQLEGQRQALATAAERGETIGLGSAYGRMGQLYQAYGLLEPAAACYRAAALLLPQDARWPFYLGYLEAEAGRHQEALEPWRRAAELDPRNPALTLHLAAVLRVLQDGSGAKKLYQEVRERPAFAAAAEAGLGRLAFAEGDYDTAVGHLRAALALQPEATNLHYSLGLALQRAGDPEAAREHLEVRGSADEIFPDPWIEALWELADNAASHLRRGHRAFVNGDLGAALAAYRRAVEVDPGNAAARRNLAVALQRQGEFEAAVAELTEASRLDPENVWILFDLGTSHLGRGALDQAIDYFRRAVERAPEFESALFNLGSTLMRGGRLAESIPYLERLVALDPHHPRAQYLLAMALFQTGKPRQAQKRLQDLAARDAADPLADLGLAAMGAARGEIEAAIDHYRAALAKSPELIEARIGLAQSLSRQDRFEEAAAELTAVARAQPAHGAAWRGAAAALIRAQRFEEAKARLEEGRRALPEDYALTHGLAHLLATCPLPALRNGPQALALASLVFRAEPSMRHAETLAMAMAAAGLFEEATALQRRILSQASGTIDPTTRRRLEDNLRRFDRRQAVQTPLAEFF